MAPVRVSAPPYTTRRKRQLPTPRCTSTSADVVATKRPLDVGYSRGCELQSTHGDVDDSLRDALLGAKEDDQEEKQDNETRSTKNGSQFPSPSTVCYIGPAVPSTEPAPLHIHMEERDSVLGETQEARLLCARRILESAGALETMPLKEVSQAPTPGVITTEPEHAEKGHLHEVSPKIATNETGPCRLPEELSDQTSDRLTNETMPEPEKGGGDSVLPRSAAEELGSEAKTLLDMNEHPVEELQTTFVEELKKQLSTAVPDELVLPEGASLLSEETRAFKGRRYLSLLSTSLPDGGFGETSSEKASQAALAAQPNDLGESCTEDGIRKYSFLGGHSLKLTEKTNSFCLQMESEDVACRDENYGSPRQKEARQQTPTKLLSPLSRPALQVEDAADNTAENVAPNPESVTLVQQNSSVLIKRRRCGSLGLDQSLRWQAMARRVPRIKGVCYSTTRHEWIAVGPLQAGSARKKNIYFSVPKHGFDGARRLAVECRRRLQAGVPVIVQEFVREQQLLFQEERTASQSEEGTVSTSDAVPLAEDMSCADNHPYVGPSAPEILSKNISAPSPDSTNVIGSLARNCSRPERSSTPASNRRQRQRPHSLAFTPLQRHASQRLGQERGGIKDGSEESKKQQAVTKETQRAGNRSQAELLKVRWEGYRTRENPGQALTDNSNRITPESKIPALRLNETVSKEPTIHRGTSGGSGASIRPPLHDPNYSMDMQNREANPARGGSMYTPERDEVMERSFSSDAPGFSTAVRLGKRTRRTVTRPDEPVSTAALLSSDPLTSETTYSCSTERSLQLWASALNHILQIEEGPTTEHCKLRNDSMIASALSAILTRAKHEKASSPAAACVPDSPAILRSISSSRTTATSPAQHPESPRRSRRRGESDKGIMQHRRHGSFTGADCYGRRSSTTSSAGSRTARVSALSEANGEHLEYSQVAKVSSDASDPIKSASPEKQSSKLWRRESFTEGALLTGKLPQFERGRPQNRRGSMAEGRRASVTSGVSRPSQEGNSCGETTTLEEMCSLAKSSRCLAGMLDLSTLGTPGAADHTGKHTATNTDSPGTESDVDSSKTILVNEQTNNAATPSTSQSAAEDTTVIKENHQGKAFSESLSPGDIFASTPTHPRRASFDCVSPFTSALAAQIKGACYVASTRLPVHQGVEQANVCSQELGLPEDANVALELGCEDLLGRFDPRLTASSEGSGASAVTRDRKDSSGKTGSGDEKVTMTQALTPEFSPLVKALCLMLVDLLQFCSWSPAALTRAGLQPSQIAFCKEEGRQMLRAALQDVSAARNVSPRLRAYIGVFEDSILANALPTSGGASEIMYYLNRVKHLTHERASPTEPEDDGKPTQVLCGEPKCGKDCSTVIHAQEHCAGEETPDANDDSARRHPNWHTHEAKNFQKRNKPLATDVKVDEPEETISRLVHEGERNRDGRPGTSMQEAAGDEKDISHHAASSTLSFWYPMPLCAEADVEHPRRTDEHQFNEGENGAFESCDVKNYQPHTQRYAHTAQPDDEQTQGESVWSSCSSRAAVYAKHYAAKGVKKWEKRRNTGCPDRPEATGGLIPEEKDADHIRQWTALNGVTLSGTTETTSSPFQTWRQVMVEALEQAKSFEDLRNGEAMKQLIRLCLPVQSATSI